MNLLSRGWWKELTFDQVQQTLAHESSNSICLYGLVSNVSNVDLDQTNADFEILCRFTSGTIKIDLTYLFILEKITLIDLLKLGKHSIWIKGKVTSFPVLTVQIKKWGFDWDDLQISKSLEYDLEVTYDNLSDDDARKWVDTLESSTNPRVKQLLEWWYWQGSGQIEGLNPSPIDTLKFWGLTTFIPAYTGISIPQSIRKDFVLFKRALLLASMRLVEND
jgi:hypothetical protein|uniref:Uncharacterized protein n=1 Tax=Bacteriophage sp. TaxID=38018 RepID=A0A7G9A4I2_9VIRU|nr:MAG: hypothetical protein [Bacteriophage sp.]